jgi:cyclopropane-fatty-acyl-phospholipid synthase
MNTQINSYPEQLSDIPWYGRAVLSLLKHLQVGRLKVTCPNGEIIFFDSSDIHIEASIHIKDWRVCKNTLQSGDIGFAEAYIDGLWDSDDIESLLSLFLLNRHIMEKAIYGTWWGRLTYRIKHWLNRNSKSGSKKNIHAHYDLGNNFYSLWLDPSMTYSSAYYERKDASLLDAQIAKYQKIIQSIGAKSSDKILEVGCGWGGFMEQASLQGIDIDCLTISKEQAHYATQRAQELSLPRGKVNILLEDYRDHHQQYDGIASIEMFEAVGQTYWPSYFKMIQRCLKPGKKACIQTIVIADELFDKYSKSSDFIQQYVFPGGMLPSLQKFCEAAKKEGLIVHSIDHFGQDYKRTLRSWHQKFNEKLLEVKSLGFDERFIRLWNLYLMYCAAGFAQKSTDVVQVTLLKPES